MTNAYSALADWFEYLNADCDYEKWSQYLYDRLRSLGVTGGKGLDIGCGSGAFTRAFAAFGFDMTGYDSSERMLQKAEQLGAGGRVKYVLCDARRLRVIGGRADFALCVNDCLNYIPPQDVPAFFARTAGCLKSYLENQQEKASEEETSSEKAAEEEHGGEEGENAEQGPAEAPVPEEKVFPGEKTFF